ncbi:TPA: hypothetical protein ACGX4N_006059, partial [Bacillus cereus]
TPSQSSQEKQIPKTRKFPSPNYGIIKQKCPNTTVIAASPHIILICLFSYSYGVLLVNYSFCY